MSKTASLITSTGATIFVGGKLYNVTPDHINFRAICEAITAGTLDLIPDLVDLRAKVARWMRTAFSGDFQLEGSQLRYKTYTFGEAVTTKALSMIDAGNNAKPLLNFLAKVCNNPSHAAREELLLFCEANGFMITSEGNIVAYKAVRDDYLDIYSGKVRYMVGDQPKMDRGAVDDDRNRTCSNGLHFAAHSYAQMFGSGRGGHKMVVEVDPADVVAIPNDYANQKGRAWTMRVIAEIDNELPKREVYDYDGNEWGDNSPLDLGEMYNDDDKDELDDFDLDEDQEYRDGYKDGLNHRMRQMDRGVSAYYDSGYKDGRLDS